MSNLSDLLPAGAAAKQLTFTDSGSGISSKAPVVLNSDGTVSPITIGADSAGTPVFFSGSSASKTQGGMASNGSGEILYAYRANNGYGTVQVVNYATPGGSITYGTPVTFLSSSTGGFSCAYDIQSGYYVIAYTNSGSNFVGECRCVSVSGTTPTVYSASSLSSYPYQVNRTDLEYDPTQQMTFLAYDYSYDDGSSFFYAGGQVRLVQPSSAYNPPTLHGNSDAEGSGSWTFLGRASMVYDPSVSKTVIHFCNTLGNAFSKIISVSGTSLSFSANTAFHSGYTTDPTATYDSNQNAQVVAFRDSSNKGYVVAGTTGASSITYGTDVEFGDGNQVHSDSNAFGVAYDANAQKVVIVYADDDDSDNGKVVFATVSGTAVTVTTPIYLDGSSGTPVRQFASVYDATGKRVIVSYTFNSNDSTRNNAVEPGATNLTTANFVGVADSAISASAAGSVIVQGGTVSGLTDPFGTVTPTYGTPVTGYTSAGAENYGMVYDSTNNRLVVAYKDGSNSDYGTAVVGELSGTSITWGTPVVFSSTASGDSGLALTFDTNVNRVVIAYRDGGNSDYGTAIVGAVSGSGSGSTIAFGSATVFESANSFYIGAGFDPVENKVLLTYRDNGNSNYATYIIGTVTTGPDAISFNTAATLNGSDVMDYNARNIAFDTSQGKFLVTYTVSGVLKAMNLSISSGSGTVGTVSTYGSGSPYIWNPETIYDSGNSKTGIIYGDSSGNYPLYFSVISMSGSSVTINTPVTISSQGNGALYGTALAYDPDLGKIGLAFRDDHTSGTSYQGSAFYGSISGTTSTWGTKSTWFSSSLGSSQTGIGAAYDTSSNKFAFVGSANAGNGVAVVSTLATTTFTAGTKYYVTTSGGFSSSADTPSVNAGIAISTTSLLLNGDS